MAEDRIARAGGAGQWREEYEIGGGTERGKNERVVADERQQCQDRYGDEAIHENEECPHEARVKMRQEPVKPQPLDQWADMIDTLVRFGVPHQILGSRSKYSSSSFLPPSPLPSCFSEAMNSMRSIHFTIL